MYKNPKILIDARCRELADQIRKMSDLSDLVELCRKDIDMAVFCGVRRDMSDEIMIRECGEQWRCCRVNKNS